MKFFIIGSGNVAGSLGAALINAGHKCSGISGRNIKKAEILAKKFNCGVYESLKKIPTAADLYLIAVNDDAIYDVAKQLPPLKGIVVHTSGSVSINALKRFSKKGVLYPVESITGKLTLSFKDIPLCIEGNNENTLKNLLKLASGISGKVFVLNSGERAKLHLAAVFANNFTNYLLEIATEILAKEKLPPELLKKLAETTVRNAFALGPINAQTGPARRNDQITINNHLEALKSNKKLYELYRLITDQIINVHKISKTQDIKS